MQEITLILSSLAGVATAAAVRRVPRNRNRILSIGASSHIKGQVRSLQIEKDILTKTISRLYQADAGVSGVQKDKLRLKYQHQLGIVLAKLEKMEQASRHPDLGPVGDGLITLMDQKLSRLDERLYEISSKMAARPKEAEPKPVRIPEKGSGKTVEAKPTIPPKGQSVEVTTLTVLPKKAPDFESLKQSLRPEPPKPVPQKPNVQTKITDRPNVVEIVPRPAQAETIPRPVQTDTTPKPVQTDKEAIIASVAPAPEIKRPTVPEPKALPEPGMDDPAEDERKLEEIKDNMAKILKELEQAEVE